MLDAPVATPLIIEYWKLLRAFERVIPRLPVEHLGRSAAQARYSAARLAELLEAGGMKIMTFDGMAYEPTLAATAVNLTPEDDGQPMVVTATLEPAIMRGFAVVALGKVTVGRAESKEGELHVSRD